jgi:hypothetical protein
MWNACWAQGQNPFAKQIEDDITKALIKTLQCQKIEVHVRVSEDTSHSIQNLVIMIDDLRLGQFTADRMTVLYENPIINLQKLKKEKELQLLSYGKNKVSILTSVESLQKYFREKAKQLNRKSVQITLKFTPPYVECFYNVPVSEISPESVQLLQAFVRGGKVEGYAAFILEAKNNALYAHSSKVIINHFLLPNATLEIFQKKFNPFDEIPVPKPFSYKINNLTVQPKYIFLTNY